MKTKKTAQIISATALTFLSCSAWAQVTLSGSTLGGLTPGASTQSFGAVFPSATFASGIWTLNENGTGGNPDWASITLPNGYDGIALGNLNSFLASGSSFNLLSMFDGNSQNNSFGINNSAYWVVTLNIPSVDGGGTVSYSALADAAGGVTGANPFNKGNSTSYFTGLGAYTSLAAGQQLNEFNTATWSSLASTAGSWTVASVGVEVGNWPMQYQATGEIGSITIGPDPVPDGVSTLSLLGICFGAVAGLRRRLARA